MSGGKPAWYRKRPRVNFKRYGDECEDHCAGHKRNVVQERPFEELNCYQKKLIIVVCRVFEQDGARRMIEELGRLQYCSLETALRVAREGGYEPQKEETTMPKAIMTEEQIIEMIGLYNGGMKPAKLAERYELDSGQVRNLLNKAKRNDKYKHLFTDKTEKTTEEQDKRFEEILDSVDAGAKKPETVENQPESVAECPENDIDRAAEAIENYLEEKELTGDITETEAMQEQAKSLTVSGEGVIELDGDLFLDGINVIERVSEKINELFRCRSYYGRLMIRFDFIPDKEPLEFIVE